MNDDLDMLRLETTAHVIANMFRLCDAWEVGHGQRSVNLIEKLAHVMSLPQHDIDMLKYIAVIHDVGKIGISDALIHRKRMTISDWDTMRGHPLNGANVIKPLNFDERIYITILQHHECWDGSGYPYGIKSLDISLWARMLLVVDTYDAISSERVSHPARTHTETIKIMKRERGVKSDPNIFDLFCTLFEAT